MSNHVSIARRIKSENTIPAHTLGNRKPDDLQFNGDETSGSLNSRRQLREISRSKFPNSPWAGRVESRKPDT